MTTTYTIYADVLFLENLVMDFIIISAAALLIKKFFAAEAPPLRRLLASAVGAVYAVLILCIRGETARILGSFFGKAVLSLVIVYIVFMPRRVLLMLKELLVFCFTGFVFAGLSLAITFLGLPVGISGGMMVTSLPAGISPFFLTAGLGYILLSVITAFLKKACINAECRVSLYIEFDGSGMWIPALIDTGNELKDPLTGAPVIIVESEAIQNILSKEIADTLTGSDPFPGALLTDAYWAKRFRMIPFRSLGCENGLLPGFKADRIKIRYDGPEKEPVSSAVADADPERKDDTDLHKETTAIICLYNKALSDSHRYSALLSPELVA